MTQQPDGICRACFWTWLARRPRPVGIFCWHESTSARLGPDGWQVEPAKSREALEQLRRDGIR